MPGRGALGGEGCTGGGALGGRGALGEVSTKKVSSACQPKEKEAAQDSGLVVKVRSCRSAARRGWRLQVCV